MFITNLLPGIFLSERMQCKSRDLENPSTVHVTVSAGQVTVWLEHRLVQVNHSLPSIYMFITSSISFHVKLQYQSATNQNLSIAY